LQTDYFDIEERSATIFTTNIIVYKNKRVKMYNLFDFTYSF